MLSNALHGFVFFGIYALLLNLYLLRLGYGPAFIGLTNAVGPLALAVASLPVGLLSRRIGSRRVLIIGYFFTAVSLTLLPLGENLPGPWPERWIVIDVCVELAIRGLHARQYWPLHHGCDDGQGTQLRLFVPSLRSSQLPDFAGNLLGGLLPGLYGADPRHDIG